MRNEKDYLSVENFQFKYADSLNSGNWQKLFKELIEKEPIDKVQLFAEFVVVKAGINFLEGLNEIPDHLFENTFITEITIPSSIKKIGEYAFANCKELKKVIMENNISVIGEYAFKNCIALEKVKMSDDIIEISEGAFENCSNLKLVSLPDNLKRIKADAFKGCNEVKLLAKTDDENKAHIWLNDNDKDFFYKHLFGKKKAKPVENPEEVKEESKVEEKPEQVEESLETLTEAFDASMPKWLRSALMSQSYQGRYFSDAEKQRKYDMFNKKGYNIKTPDMNYKNISAAEGNILTKITNLGIDLSRAKFLNDGGIPSGGRAGIREKNGLSDNPPQITGNLPFYLFKWTDDSGNEQTQVWAKGLNDLERFQGPREKNPNMCLYEVQRQDYPTLLADFVYLNLDDPNNFEANTRHPWRDQHDSLEINSDTNRQRMKNPQLDDKSYSDELTLRNLNPFIQVDKSGYLVNPDKYGPQLLKARQARFAQLMSTLGKKINTIWEKFNNFNSSIKINSDDLNREDTKKLLKSSNEINTACQELVELYESVCDDIERILKIEDEDERNSEIEKFYNDDAGIKQLKLNIVTVENLLSKYGMSLSSWTVAEFDGDDEF